MNKIICISRQYASGGHEIGELLAKQFDVPLYDKEIISESAKASGLSKELIESHDEDASSSFIYSIAMGRITGVGGPYIASPGDFVYYAQAEAIRALAQKGPCIMIGRGAGEILRDMPDSVRIFIYASSEFRVERALCNYGNHEKNMLDFLNKIDRQRAVYSSHYNNRRWGMIESFDLAVDSSRCGIIGAVDTISTFLLHL